MSDFIAPYEGALTLAVLSVIVIALQNFVSAYYRNAVEPHPAGSTIAADHGNTTYRLVRSFENSVENAAIFFPMLFLAVLLQASATWVYWVCLIYLLARIFHWVMYAINIQPLRTLGFAVGFFATFALAIVTLL